MFELKRLSGTDNICVGQVVADLLLVSDMFLSTKRNAVRFTRLAFHRAETSAFVQTRPVTS